MTTTQTRRDTAVRSSTAGWVPWTGLTAVVLSVVAVILAGWPPDAGSSPSEIVDHYADNATPIRLSALVVVASLVLLVLFGAYLRTVLSSPEPGGDMFPTVVLIGTAVLGAGLAVDATISFALVEAAGDVDPVAMQSLQALWDNDFVPMQLGVALVLLGAGLSILRNATLPKWLGWAALVLTVVGLTPLGLAAAAGLGLWIVVVSVLLGVRAEPGRT
jgi:hypothetical protein